MKKLVLLGTMVATLSCLSFAEYQVNLPGYEAAKGRYWELMEKVAKGSATDAENAELSDLCQVYGYDLPVTEPVEARGSDNLDNGGSDSVSATVIPDCPYADTGFFDGTNTCSVPSASPYNEVFYRFQPSFTGRYQMRVRSYSGTVPAIRILREACCNGGITVAFASGSVATDCPNPFGGMEPSTVIAYLFWLLSADSTYYIHVGTNSSTVYTSAYDFNLWCFGCPPDESPSHQTCATAQTIACQDSVFGDSAYYGTPASNDWYKVVVPDFSPNACSLRVFVGGREMGHCTSGRYPSGTLATDGRYTLYKERVGETCVYDSVGYSDDDGCSHDAVKTWAVDPGTYYIRIWNFDDYDYVLTTACIEYNPSAACCFLDGSCEDMVAAACAAAGGWSKPIGVLCASSPCPTSSCPYSSRDNEPNNTCGPSVDQVFCDSSYCGVITPATDVDWYKLVIADCESLVVDIFGNATPSQFPYNQGLNPYVYLYKSDCSSILASNDNNSGVYPDPVGTDSRLKKAVGPGTYYIKVQSSSNLTSGPYVMHITCIWRECLPGDFCSNAIAITGLPFVDTLKTTCGFLDDCRPTCLGSYGNGPDVIYTIELDGSTCFGCSLFTNTGSYGSVSLYANCPTSASEPCIAKSVGASSGPYGFTCQGISGALPAGTYYIMVDNYPSPPCITTYTLRVFQCDCSLPCPYPSHDNEATNNTCGTGVPVIASGDTLCGADSITADADWYQFTLTECDSVKIDVWADETPGQWAYGKGLNPYAYLYKSDCMTLIASNDNVGGNPYNYDSRLVSGCVLQAGTYYIKVTATASTYGPYILILTCFPAACPDVSGDVCATPRVIPSLPYTDVATTCCYYADDYRPTTCLSSYGNGPDVIYQLTLDGSTCFACTLWATGNTGGSPYGSISLWDACPTPTGTCLAKASAYAGPYVINCQGPLGPLAAGNYYIMIDNEPSPPCINYTLKVVPCDCPPPCETYTLCGTPGEVEVNNTCPPPFGQAEIGCDMSVYGLHCRYTDTDFWKITIPAMNVMTIKVYTGPTCSANPPVGVYARYYNDLCGSPTSGTTSPIVITNSTGSPLVKYLEVYDSGAMTQTLYNVTSTCCAIRDYCTDPIVAGPGPDCGGYWALDSTVNTCCAANVIDTVWAHGCGTGTKYVSGPDVIFKVILGTPGTMRISANSVGSGDGQFYVFTDCANPKTTCIASEDYYSGTTVERDTVAVAADTYYVAVSHYGSTACGDMHLQIDCDLPAWVTGKNWNNASGGSWFGQGNWTPFGYPGSTDTARITLIGTYTVTIDTSNAAVRRLVLDGTSGTQTLRIVAPAQQMSLSGNSDIGVNGRLDLGRNGLLLGAEETTDTLTNNGTILLDSSGTIDLGWFCSLRNLSGGSILFSGPGSITAYYIEGFGGSVENGGSIIKSGPDTLSLFCAYNQLSGGTLTLSGGELKVWSFATNGQVTLASGTVTRVGEEGEPPPSSWAVIDTGGVVELQGTASISGGGNLWSRGEIRHTSAGTSVISVSYRPISPPNDGDIRVLAGKLTLTADDNAVEGPVVIWPLAELEVAGALSPISSVTSAVADSGTLVLAGYGGSWLYGSFPFSGNLRITSDSLFFEPVTDPVSVRTFTVDSGAVIHSSVTIQADSVHMNGGRTNADVVVNDHYGWTAGTFLGIGGTTVTIDTGTSLAVSGPAPKQLDTRDLFISGTASMSGSGQFSMSDGASIVVDPAGSLTIGDSITITGTGDSLINHGQLTFNCPNDTAFVSAFLLNQSIARPTPGTIDILSGKVECESATNLGTVEMLNGSELIITVQWINGGQMIMNSGSRCTIIGTLQNEPSGVIHMDGAAEIAGSGTVSNAGLIDYTGGEQRSITNTVIGAVFHNLESTGRLEIISDTLTLSSGGSNAGDILIHAGSVLRLLGTFVNEAAGTICGGGTLDISGATFTNSGAIAPGESLGTLSIVGALSTQGTIHIEVAGQQPGSDYDRLLIGGNAGLGGTLHLSRLYGFMPTLTDTFRCINYASRSGEFAAVTGTPVGNGTFMEIDYRPTEIVQYVCNGVSDIQFSVASILDSVHRELTDTVTLEVCNVGHCPLVWSSNYVQHSPAEPPWLTIIEGNDGLLERTLCKTMKWAINTAGLSPGTYSGDVVVTSNDPDEAVTEIPVQLVVPDDRVNDLTIRLNLATNSITLSWSAVFGANSYKIYSSEPGSYDPNVFLYSTAGTIYTHTGTLGSGGALRLIYHVVASTDEP